MRKDLTPFTGRGSVWDFMSEMEKAFDDLWGNEAQGQGRRPASPRFVPAVDLHESEDFYLLSVDVPGMSDKDIQINVHQGRLTLRGERKFEHREDQKGFHRFEKSYGNFERSFQLPSDVKEDKIQARYENGVLEVMVPKAEKEKPRNIQVETSKGNLFSRLLSRTDAAPTTDKEQH